MKNFAKIFFAAFFLAIFLSVFFSRTQKPAEEIFIAEPTFSNDIYLPAAAFVPTTAPTQTPAPTPEPTPTPEPKFFSARIANVGDFMCHQVQLDAAYDKTGGVYDFDPCFKYIKPYIADADYAVGNLETTLAGGASSGYPIFNSPDAYAAAIKNAGFDFVTTANNHGNDKREAGIVRTIETLNGVGLAFTGTNLSQDEQENIFLIEVNGITFALLAYSYSTNGIPLASGKPYLLNLLDDTEMVRRHIELARTLADAVIVYPHAGDEYAERPSARYRSLYRDMISWGADAVMASHPHVLQPAEAVSVTSEDGAERVGFIAYSMGNFLSGQRPVPRDVGAVFYLTFEMTEGGAAYIAEASYSPTWVQDKTFIIYPMYEALLLEASDFVMGLSASDYSRLSAAHRHTAQKMLGREVPADEILPEYILYRHTSKEDQ